MPDFAMCNAEYVIGSAINKCPYADTCYRHIAKPSIMQPYIAAPYDPKSPTGCRFFVLPFDTSGPDKDSIMPTIFAMYLKLMAFTATVASDADFYSSKQMIKYQINTWNLLK